MDMNNSACYSIASFRSAQNISAIQSHIHLCVCVCARNALWLIATHSVRRLCCSPVKECHSVVVWSRFSRRVPEIFTRFPVVASAQTKTPPRIEECALNNTLPIPIRHLTMHTQHIGETLCNASRLTWRLCACIRAYKLKYYSQRSLQRKCPLPIQMIALSVRMQNVHSYTHLLYGIPRWADRIQLRQIASTNIQYRHSFRICRRCGWRFLRGYRNLSSFGGHKPLLML